MFGQNQNPNLTMNTITQDGILVNKNGYIEYSNVTVTESDDLLIINSTPHKKNDFYYEADKITSKHAGWYVLI